jgi:23S rRNA (cytosine1962-C5)-methyltransferase
MKPKPVELPEIQLLAPQGWREYQLLDSGEGKTLERFGPYTLIRPEPQAIWPRSLPSSEWQKAQAVMQEEAKEYGGSWKLLQAIPKAWEMHYRSLSFQVQLGSSRHIGVFPEQASHWDWIAEQIEAAGRPLRVLNLFGYSGLATLAAANAGAQVTHVDSSKHALNWASYNLKLSGLAEKPVRWIAEDALRFTQREARRGNKYQGLILDPPKFGRGSDGKVWDFYKNLPELLAACRGVLAPDACFIVLTAYAIQASALVPYQALQEIVGGTGNLTCGELITVEESAGHVLSHALFARWAR